MKLFRDPFAVIPDTGFVRVRVNRPGHVEQTFNVQKGTLLQVMAAQLELPLETTALLNGTTRIQRHYVILEPCEITFDDYVPMTNDGQAALDRIMEILMREPPRVTDPGPPQFIEDIPMDDFDFFDDLFKDDTFYD